MKLHLTPIGKWLRYASEFYILFTDAISDDISDLFQMSFNFIL